MPKGGAKESKAATPNVNYIGPIKTFVLDPLPYQTVTVTAVSSWIKSCAFTCLVQHYAMKTCGSGGVAPPF
jgi:hypothetical protein